MVARSDFVGNRHRKTSEGLTHEPSATVQNAKLSPRFAVEQDQIREDKVSRSKDAECITIGQNHLEPNKVDLAEGQPTDCSRNLRQALSYV